MTNRIRPAGTWHRVGRSSIVAVLLMTALVGLAPNQATAHDRPDSRSNPVVVWDLNAEHAIFDGARQSPTAAARSFAIVHGAVYDAVNAIAGTPYEPYLIAPPSHRGDSTPAAVATAAHQVLLWMFPDQAASLNSQYDRSLAAIPDSRSKDGGIAVGAAAAAAMIDARRDDGASDLSETWPTGTAPGDYRLTPPNFVPTGAWTATLTPFVLPDPGIHRVPGPPALKSAAYARDLNEVQRLGSATSPLRTADQTDAAIWWDDPRQVEWKILRQLATTYRLSTVETARLFAMVDISAADSLIACYKEKVRWKLWRPVTAIPLADTDGNRATRSDPAWTPLRTTAPSAEYPSGHACYTSSFMTALRTYFGRDHIRFSAFSTDSGTTREYRSLSAATAELGSARVWAGVHYRFSTDDGQRLGTAVTHDVLDSAFTRRGD